MKAVCISLLLLALPAPLLAQAQTGFVSQAEMNANACIDKNTSNDTLEKLYKKIADAHADDKIFLKYLEQSQNAWKTYRDAQMSLKYPKEYSAYYGSMRSFCVCNDEAAFTKTRIKEMQQWVDGNKTGSACTGTIGMKSPAKH